MNIEELKKAIVEESEQCSDKDLLLDVLLKFYPHLEVEETENSVEETEATYAASNAFKLPEWKLKEIKEDSEKLKRGELQLLDWDDVEASIRQEYGP